jgi:hypothetical protein
MVTALMTWLPSAGALGWRPGVRTRGEKVREKAGRLARAARRLLRETLSHGNENCRSRAAQAAYQKEVRTVEKLRLTVSPSVHLRPGHRRRGHSWPTLRPSPGSRVVDEGNKTEAAKKVGTLVAKICLSKKIDRVVFDRNGYLYHGRVSALADAARQGGLKF